MKPPKTGSAADADIAAPLAAAVAKAGAPVVESAVVPAGGHGVPAVVVQPVAAPPEHAQPAGRPWIRVGGVALILGLGLLAYLQPWVAKAPEVAVEVVALGPVTRVLAVNGRVAGVKSVDVRPLVGGTLTEVLVAEGDLVQADAALARIDAAAQAAVVRQALAGADAAAVAEAEAQATLARTAALGSNAARVSLDTAARAAQSAAQETARMTALLEQAQIQFGNFTIRAPLSGTVLVLAADPGQIVDTSTVLMTIADLGQLVVETDVDESYATQIRVGQPAVLQLAGEATVRAGKVSFVSQRVDETTGGLAVKLTPTDALSAPIGLTVTANITIDHQPAAITVPRAALLHDAAGDFVLTVPDATAQRRAVTVIEWPAARLMVTSGWQSETG